MHKHKRCHAAIDRGSSSLLLYFFVGILAEVPQLRNKVREMGFGPNRVCEPATAFLLLLERVARVAPFDKELLELL